jgi:Zn-dependent peptidase ImmA (M78 family)
MNLPPVRSGVTAGQMSGTSTTLVAATNLIIERARQLTERLVESKGCEEPPISVEELAHLQGIKIIEKTDLGKLDAALVKLPHGYVMRVNSSHHPFRQNFSCAHEIGHTLLHELEQESLENVEFRFVSCEIARKDKERLCDAAAAELLMPERIFGKYLSGFGVSVAAIEGLSNIFKVSIPAVAIRVAQVSEEPCLAILWHRWRKVRSEGFGLIWCAASGKKRQDEGYYVRGRQYVRDPSALLKAYQSDSLVKSFKFFEFGASKRRCYMESRGFGYGETRYVVSLVFPERC